MNLKFKAKGFLRISISAISTIFFVQLPNKISAAPAPPACPVSGSVAALSANATCLGTPEKFEITIHEIGICKSHPLAGSLNSKAVDLSTCFASMPRQANGVIGDLANSGALTLPGPTKRPDPGTYPYAYVILSNELILKASYKLSGGTIYYSDNTGQNLSTTGPSVDWSEELDDFGGASFDAEWGTDPSDPMTMPGEGNVSALLLNSSYKRSANAGASSFIFAAFSAFSGKEVVITEKTNGIQVELHVTDSGYAVDSNASGIPEEFGSSPFKPVFKTY